MRNVALFSDPTDESLTIYAAELSMCVYIYGRRCHGLFQHREKNRLMSTEKNAM
jgi:hypothetical protein